MNILDRTIVLIPAFKKSVRFQDDLVRKLQGIPLVQRAIEKALSVGLSESRIHVLTDSEEVQLIARRAGIGEFLDPVLDWSKEALTVGLCDYVVNAEKRCDLTIVLSPYSPLLKKETIKTAIVRFESCGEDILKAVCVEKRSSYDESKQNAANAVFGSNDRSHWIESNSFTLLRTGVLTNDLDKTVRAIPFETGEDSLEIESLRDWWVCEKLLRKKRIVFRVIGNDEVGMGHIYRALSLAHELTDHEVLFVTDKDSDIAVRELAGYEYWTGVFDPVEVIAKIIDLNPDAVVFDALNTKVDQVRRLRNQRIAVLSFEDLGKGAQHTNLTINELYDEPQASGKHFRWGREFFFVRDEFHSAKPHYFKDHVNALLLTFGGTDQHDLSRKVLQAVYKICRDRGVHIHIVTGPGYRNYQQLAQEVNQATDITLTHATGIMSGVMEQCPLAITSNGRTVYELAHMSIPAIVIDQHDRESSHRFACQENGFLPLGLYQSGVTEDKVKKKLVCLLDDQVYRQALFRKVEEHNFSIAKKTIVKWIIDLAEGRK